MRFPVVNEHEERSLIGQQPTQSNVDLFIDVTGPRVVQALQYSYTTINFACDLSQRARDPLNNTVKLLKTTVEARGRTHIVIIAKGQGTVSPRK